MNILDTLSLGAVSYPRCISSSQNTLIYFVNPVTSRPRTPHPNQIPLKMIQGAIMCHSNSFAGSNLEGKPLSEVAQGTVLR